MCKLTDLSKSMDFKKVENVNTTQNAALRKERLVKTLNNPNISLLFNKVVF